jgi:hypothetical protein
MDHFERQLREALSSPLAAGILVIAASQSGVAAGLEQAFPFEGSKIDWRTVKGHLNSSDEGGFRRFFANRRDELGGNAKAFYLSDNLTDCAVGGSLFAFERHLDAILSIPAHHYFVAEDFSWCIAHSMEGDSDFGWSASKS